MTLRTALIAGATGLVGQHCLETLLDDRLYTKVTAITRRPIERQHPKLTNTIVDFNDLGVSESRLEANDVFCCLGTTIRTAGTKEAFARVDRTYVASLARHTRAMGAQRFALVSAVGADPQSMSFYFKVKGEAEHDVRTVGFPQLEILQPSMLMGDRKEHRPGESLAIPFMRATSWLMQGPLRSRRIIHARDVAHGLIGSVRSEVEGVRVHTHDAIIALARLLEAEYEERK